MSSSKAIFLSVLIIALPTEVATAVSIFATIVAMDASEMSDITREECEECSPSGGIRYDELNTTKAPLIN